FKHFRESLLQITLDIVDVFNSNRYAEQVWQHPGRELFFVTQLLMCCRRWLNDQRLTVTQVREVAYQFQVVDKPAGVMFRALERKGQYSAKPIPQILFGELVIGTAFKSRVIYTFHKGMFFQPLRECERIIDRPLNT